MFVAPDKLRRKRRHMSPAIFLHIRRDMFFPLCPCIFLPSHLPSSISSSTCILTDLYHTFCYLLRHLLILKLFLFYFKSHENSKLLRDENFLPQMSNIPTSSTTLFISIHELFPSMIDSLGFSNLRISTFFRRKFTDTKNFRAFCVPLLRTCMSPKFISCEVGSERMTREDIKKTLCQPPVGLDTIRQFLLSRGRIFPTVKSYFRCCAIFSLSRTLARAVVFFFN